MQKNRETAPSIYCILSGVGGGGGGGGISVYNTWECRDSHLNHSCKSLALFVHHNYLMNKEKTLLHIKYKTKIIVPTLSMPPPPPPILSVTTYTPSLTRFPLHAPSFSGVGV